MVRFIGLSALFCLMLVGLSCQSDEEIKRQRYITEGILVYKNNCANCHQTDGKGLAALYPPIAGSDYLVNKNSVICLIRYGQQGPIVVNGKRYNRPMPAQPQLSALEIAELTTYIYNEWGDETTLTDVKAVTPVLEQCKKGVVSQ
ncbi:c-type cytochrome [Spirosoma arcticum]